MEFEVTPAFTTLIGQLRVPDPAVSFNTAPTRVADVPDGLESVERNREDLRRANEAEAPAICSPN